MLISYKYKIIFLHNPKTAGVSIKGMLINLHKINPKLFLKEGEEELLKDKITPHLFKIPKIHVTISDCLNHIVKDEYDFDVWNNFYKFSVVRNPWDRMLSYWNFMSEKDTNHEVFRKEFPSLESWLINLEIESKETSGSDVNRHSGLINQHAWTHHDGKQIVNKVLRFENLEEDLEEVFKWMGVPQTKLDHRNKSKNECEYKKAYNERTIKIVENIFSKDIELFGYEF